MDKDNSMIYDDVFRTIQERMPRLLIPLINEVFQTDYAKDTAVTRLPEEYQKIVSKVVADSCSMVGNHVYHFECQSTGDGTMILRMAEYDFMIGLNGAEMEHGHYRIRFPESCVIYLRAGKKMPEEEWLEIELADGGRIKYRVPVIKVQNYTIEDLFLKKLYIYLPYYIMRYERELPNIGRDAAKMKKLLEEYEGIRNRLWREIGQEETGLYQDMLRLMRRIANYQLRNETDLKERMERVMGGKVLKLPSDVLRLAEKRGMSQGMLRGEERVNRLILILQEHSRMDEIIRAASDREYQEKLFEEFGL